MSAVKEANVQIKMSINDHIFVILTQLRFWVFTYNIPNVSDKRDIPKFCHLSCGHLMWYKTAIIYLVYAHKIVQVTFLCMSIMNKTTSSTINRLPQVFNPCCFLLLNKYFPHEAGISQQENCHDSWNLKGHLNLSNLTTREWFTAVLQEQVFEQKGSFSYING